VKNKNRDVFHIVNFCDEKIGIVHFLLLSEL